MADRDMKQGDTWPPLPIQLREHDGSPTDLTDMDEIRVYIVGTDHTITTDTQNVTVDGDPKDGNGYYSWQAGDTDYPGEYQVEYEVVWDDGRVRRYPTVGYRTLLIIPNLGEAAE